MHTQIMAELSLYIKKSEDGNFSFNYDFKQTWHHKFNMQGVKPEHVYIKNFMDRRNEKNADLQLSLLKFILKVCFATENQIKSYLSSQGFPLEDIDKTLEMFLHQRIINMFIISKYPLNEIPEDALKCYSLDFGGKYILSHYGTEDVLSWISTNAVRGVEYITKYLTTTQFYLALLNSVPENIRYFESFANFNIGKRDVQTNAKFEIMSGHTPRGFILEVVRKYDIPSGIQKKSEKLNVLMSEGYIEKYFSINPVVILLAENDKMALEVADIYYRNTNSTQFRLLTDIRIKNGFDDKSFMKYDPNKKTLIIVKSSLFLPKIINDLEESE